MKRSMLTATAHLAMASLILVFWSNLMQAQDRYANIGFKNWEKNEDLLIEPLPPVLPEKYLPVEHASSARFTPMEKVDTPEELKVELEKMRERFKPFMRKLAPDELKTRSRVMLTTFQWKVEEDSDLKNFQQLARGEGNWENVSVPHYDEPLGQKATYYYKKIAIAESQLKGNLYLCFKGVDYIAKVFVNGVFVGMHEGFFAPFEFDISKYVNIGQNDLLIKVENDFSTHGNKNEKGQIIMGNKIYAATGPGYDEPMEGWHHCPPAMGIYQECFLETRNDIFINDLFARPMLSDSLVETWVEVKNLTNDFQNIKFRLSVYGQNFNETQVAGLIVEPYETVIPGKETALKYRALSELIYPLYPGGYNHYYKIQLPLKNVRTWRPNEPWLYEVQVEVLDEKDEVQDVQVKEFGMRSFTMDTTSTPKGKMYLNGEMVRLRGANTMGFLQNDVMKKDWGQLTDDLLLAKVANMNYLRLTQRPVQDEVYAYCDMLGIMTQVDFPLFGTFSRNQFAEGVKQVEEMERLVRSHPSTVLTSYINEPFKDGGGVPQRSFATKQEYNRVYKAFDQAILLTNPDRVIKTVDGDYDAPSAGLPDNHCYNMWYNGHGIDVGMMHKGHWQGVKPDWFYGCGEFGAEGLDPVKTMKKHYPNTWLPKDKKDEKQWTSGRISHAQTHNFHYMWFPTQHKLEHWVDISQAHQAEAVGLATEAFRRDARMVSFAVHLFIDAWPAGWMKSIMDVDRNPKKAYFTYRDALQPLMISLRTDRNKFFEGEKVKLEAWICNDFNEVFKGYKLRYQLEQGDKIVFASEAAAAIASNAPNFNGFIEFEAPKVKSRTKYTLRASIFDENNNPVIEADKTIDIFPNIDMSSLAISLIGKKGRVASQLVHEMGSKITNASSIIFIDDFAQYALDSVAINEKVKKGSTVVFLNLEAGKYQITNSLVTVENASYGRRYFANPRSGHPKMKEFEDFDFKFWYEKSIDRISPLLSSYFDAEDWTPLLLSGRTSWEGSDGATFAVAEKVYGKGKFYISQLDLAGRVNENPTAKMFFSRLFR